MGWVGSVVWWVGLGWIDENRPMDNSAVMQSQKFSPRRRPTSLGGRTAKFNQLETVTTFTYKPSLVKIDARNFELS